MNLLLIHPDFPGQFDRLARSLAKSPSLPERGDFDVVAVGCGARPAEETAHLAYRYYTHPTGAPQRVFPGLRSFDDEVRRGRSVADLLGSLREAGFEPDVVLAHPGWGDALFVPEVFPRARFLAYLEYFYNAHGSDLDFDPEFPPPKGDLRYVPLRNTSILHAFAAAERCITPTHWQAGLFPPALRGNLQVLHEGIDTATVAPRANARYTLPTGQDLSGDDEVITYVSRSLEPYRGFHVFMRALPELLRRRPNAQVVLVGRERVSYGRAPRAGGSWKAAMLAEVGDDLDLSRVHFLGSVPYEAYLRLLQVSRVHVYLTYPFVLSWSLIEAMSCGCAIVGSATGPVTEAIEDGVNGRLVGFFDRDALVRTTVELLDDKAQRARLGQAARDTAVERFDFKSRSLPAWLKLLDCKA